MWPFFLSTSLVLAATPNLETLEVGVPAVTLVDQRGGRVDLRTLLDGPSLVQFIFTTCPTICPAMARSFAGLEERLPGVRLVSISIDPEHDTPDRLRAYAGQLGAGSNWTMLTGGLDDVLTVQKAFDAYRGNKMRHEPVTYARLGGGWVRLRGLMTSSELATESRRLLARSYASCAACHRRSGMGASEGGVVVPPITADVLFGDGPRHAELYPRLFQGTQPEESWSRLRDPRVRPAYTEESLATLLRTGRDPAGRMLDTLMPRVALPTSEVRHLAAYLRTLGAGAPGVSRDRLAFATVVAEASDPAERKAMVETLQAYIRWKQADAGRRNAAPGSWDREAVRPAFREWTLDVWELKGPESTWDEQLRDYHAQSPPFALLMGLSRQHWRPVHEFAERAGLPCLFPLTDSPVSSGPNDYTLYFTRGLELELEAARRAMGPEDHVLMRLDGPVPSTGRLFAPASLARPGVPPAIRDRVVLATTHAQPGPTPPHAYRARAWLRSRGLSADHLDIRLNAWWVMSLLDHSLMKMAGRFDRDYLIETIEAEAENTPNPGVYTTLSLGPGQRFASRSTALVPASR